MSTPATFSVNVHSCKVHPCKFFRHCPLLHCQLLQFQRPRFVVKDNLLYHIIFFQLVVTTSRREHVMRMGHDTFGGHMSVKRTKARISYAFYWPTMSDDCHKYV